MTLAFQRYSGLWPEVLDVSANQPYNLLCRGDGRELRVEVKGTTSRGHAGTAYAERGAPRRSEPA